jgi:hypothetical protein
MEETKQIPDLKEATIENLQYLTTPPPGIFFEILFKDIKNENLLDNKDYSNAKYSLIPEGTKFFHRSYYSNIEDQNNYFKNTTYTWLDYTGNTEIDLETIQNSVKNQTNTNTHSFLIDSPTLEYGGLTCAYFGPYLHLVETTKNIVVFHFPCCSSNLDKNFTAYTESFISNLCDKDGSLIGSNICSSYTLEFLTNSASYGLSNYYEGYREFKTRSGNLTSTALIELYTR